jgi:hypothetical protein
MTWIVVAAIATASSARPELSFRPSLPLVKPAAVRVSLIINLSAPPAKAHLISALGVISATSPQVFIITNEA